MWRKKELAISLFERRITADEEIPFGFCLPLCAAAAQTTAKASGTPKTKQQLPTLASAPIRPFLLKRRVHYEDGLIWALGHRCPSSVLSLVSLSPPALPPVLSHFCK